MVVTAKSKEKSNELRVLRQALKRQKRRVILLTDLVKTLKKKNLALEKCNKKLLKKKEQKQEYIIYSLENLL